MIYKTVYMNHLIKKIIYVSKGNGLGINLMLLTAIRSLPNIPVSFTEARSTDSVELFFLKTGKRLNVDFVVPRSWWEKRYSNREAYMRLDTVFYKLFTLTFPERLLTPVAEGESTWDWDYGIANWGII